LLCIAYCIRIAYKKFEFVSAEGEGDMTGCPPPINTSLHPSKYRPTEKDSYFESMSFS